MFDLFRSRAKAVRYLLGAVLLMVAASLVITLIPGYGTWATGDDFIVAEIGGEALTTRDVQLAIQAHLRSKSITQEMVEHFLPEVVNQLVTERALAYQAERMGFRVTGADLARYIHLMLPHLFQGGEFAGKEAYAMALSQINTTIPEFENNVRRQLLLESLQHIAVSGVVVTAKEVEQEFRRQNERIRLDYVAFDLGTYRPQVTVTQADLQDYYEKNKASYQIGERRSFNLLIVDLDRMMTTAMLSDAELKQMYNASIDRYRTPDRVRVRHILLKTADRPQDDIPRIRAQAEDLLKKLRAGADFADLARKHSEDPGSASKGGELDWVVRGQTVKNFEESAFSLAPKQISDIVSTEYGFHILQVHEKQGARLRPFEEVKGELYAEKSKQLLYDHVQRQADTARQELVRTPQQAEEIARRLGLPYFRVSEAAFTDEVPEIGFNENVARAVEALGPGGVTPVVQVSDKKLAVASLIEVHPPRAARLEEVADRIRELVLTEKARRLTEERARDFEEKYKAAGGDLRKAAAAAKVEVKDTLEMDRQGYIPGVGPVGGLIGIFAQPKDATGGPLQVAGRTVYYRITDKIDADMSLLPEQREELLERLRSQKTRERRELLEDAVLTRLIKEGKVKIHENVVKRLASNYRG